MADPKQSDAWLDLGKGQTLPINDTFSFGRLAECDLTISEKAVSRRHAIVQRQDVDEYWLIDMGSRNGTSLNDKRLTLPTKLNNGDKIEIGGVTSIFRTASISSKEKTDTQGQGATSINIRTANRWLLVTDIVGSTTLATRTKETELAAMVGSWMATCSEVIEARDGVVNKFLGDGFLAYWTATENSAANVRAAINDLMRLQGDPDQLDFRAVLHYGPIAVGGYGAVAEESLTGIEVTFAFRMERLASKLVLPILISEPAQRSLGDARLTEIGSYHIEDSGRDEEMRFFRPI